jgi:hypothetical protein
LFIQKEEEEEAEWEEAEMPPTPRLLEAEARAMVVARTGRLFRKPLVLL